MDNVFLVLKYLPVLINAIKAIEEALPASGKGAEKLDFVKGILESAYDGGKKFEEVWPKFESTIALAVKFFKRTGVFA